MNQQAVQFEKQDSNMKEALRRAEYCEEQLKKERKNWEERERKFTTERMQLVSEKDKLEQRMRLGNEDSSENRALSQEMEKIVGEKMELVQALSKVRAQLDELENNKKDNGNFEELMKQKLNYLTKEKDLLQKRLISSEELYKQKESSLTKQVEDLNRTVETLKTGDKTKGVFESQASNVQSSRFYAQPHTEQKFMMQLASLLISVHGARIPQNANQQQIIGAVTLLGHNDQAKITELNDELRKSRNLKADQGGDLLVEALKQSMDILKLEKERDMNHLLDRIRQLETQLRGQNTRPQMDYHQPDSSRYIISDLESVTSIQASLGLTNRR